MEFKKPAEEGSLPRIVSINKTFSDNNQDKDEYPELSNKKSKKNFKPIQKYKNHAKSNIEHIHNSLSKESFMNSDNSMNKIVNTISNEDFPQQDKYLNILENNRALKRKIKELDDFLDGQEMKLELTLKDQKLAKFNTDKDMVNMMYSNFKNMLDLYNDSLGKVNEQLQPVCQIRSEFLKRLIQSYTGLFSKIKSHHINEMTKYVTKINHLNTKNKLYERMFDEAKRKEASQNQKTNIVAMNAKLDYVEREMSISNVFAQDRNEKDSLMNLIAEKADRIGRDNFDPLSKDVLTQLQEILSAMISVNSGSGLLSNYIPIERTEFQVADWEKDIVGKLKNAQFTAAKAMLTVINRKDNYVDEGIQTEIDPLK
jgi:hypothetical protein